MKASATQGKSPTTGAKRRELVAKLAQAHQQYETTRKAAKSAKAEFKEARKAHRQAKQAAKEARRAYKALKKEFAAVKSAAKSRARRTRLLPIRVRKSPPPPFTPLPEELEIAPVAPIEPTRPEPSVTPSPST